ncbi:hypothetical protein [Nostoc sp.]|uniref:hypothetical protein n=1 Tax=Nostoc sp. TaxID=1180 RepID=UPI002FFB4753
MVELLYDSKYYLLGKDSFNTFGSHDIGSYVHLYSGTCYKIGDVYDGLRLRTFSFQYLDNLSGSGLDRLIYWFT